MSEKWKAVIGYESRYEVSNRGRVRSIGRWAPHPKSKTGVRWWPEKIMTQTRASLKNNEGMSYLYVGLYDDNKKQKQHLVHRLVLEAFRGTPTSDNQVGMHMDDNPENNRLRNLRWGTYADNALDRERKGRGRVNFDKGENASSAKLSNRQVKQIAKLLAKGTMVKDLAQRFNVSGTTISHIKSGRYWSSVTGIKPVVV